MIRESGPSFSPINKVCVTQSKVHAFGTHSTGYINDHVPRQDAPVKVEVYIFGHIEVSLGGIINI